MTQNPQWPQQPQPRPGAVPPGYPQPPGDQQGAYPPGPGYPQPPGFAPPPPRKPVWPTVIGIISLCFAGLGLLFGGIGVLMLATGAGMASQRAMWSNMPSWFEPLQLVAGVFGLLVSTFLLIGGILLIKRRPAGVTLHFVYCVLKVVAIGLGLVISVTMMNHMRLPGNVPPQMRQMMPAMRTMTSASSLIGVPFQLAYPVFLLIWLARAKVRQHVRTWKN